MIGLKNLGRLGRVCVLAGIAGFALAACDMQGNEKADPKIFAGGPVDGWAKWGHGEGGMRYSANTQITPDNVKNLQVAWSYRTGDLSRVTRERCPCGRTTARMGKVIGRTDDMFIVSGVNVFPSTVESVLFRIEGLEPHYEIVLERKGALDTFTVRVEVTEALFNGWMDDLVAFERQVSETLRSALLVRPKVKLVEAGSLTRFEGKARRVIDKRPLG